MMDLESLDRDEQQVRELNTRASALEAEALDESFPMRRRIAASQLAQACRAHTATICMMGLFRLRYEIAIAPRDPLTH